MEIVGQLVSHAARNYIACRSYLTKITHFFFCELKLFGKFHALLLHKCFLSVPGFFQRGVKGVLSLIFHKEFINEQKYMDFNAISLDEKSLILMAMSKIIHFYRKY